MTHLVFSKEEISRFHALKSDKLTLTDLLAKGKRAEVVSVKANTMEGKFEDLSTKLSISDINLASKPRQFLRPCTKTQAFIPAHLLDYSPAARNAVTAD